MTTIASKNHFSPLTTFKIAAGNSIPISASLQSYLYEKLTEFCKSSNTGKRQMHSLFLTFPSNVGCGEVGTEEQNLCGPLAHVLTCSLFITHSVSLTT